MSEETKLITCTNTYFVKGSEHPSRWPYYLTEAVLGLNKPLLFAEMEYANLNSKLPKPRGSGDRKRLLVLLVGDSFEPLLQSILAYQPDKLLLIFSYFYGERPINSHEEHTSGTNRKDDFIRILNLMETGRKQFSLPFTSSWSLDQCDQEPHFVEDTEIAVFTKLREQVSAPGWYSDWEIFVDITGGKKTMVAGAFMFAAYTDASVRYVDFDRYSVNDRRPYGYSCNFREVENLYTMFHLGAWERTRGFYQAYDFHSALAVLPVDVGKPDPGHAPLKTFLQMCSDWSNSRYVDAQKKYESLPDEVKKLAPKVIVELGNLMQPIGEDDIAFLTNVVAVTWYARDAYLHAVRIAREGQNHDTDMERRNAFTRAYALHETLINARLALLLRQGELQKDDVVINLGETRTVKYLLDRLFIDAKIELLSTQRYGTYRRQSTTPIFSLGNISSNELESLRTERNKVVHGWHKVERHQEALRLAKYNLQNYLTAWARLTTDIFDKVQNDRNFECPDWVKLIIACGISSPIRNI